MKKLLTVVFITLTGVSGIRAQPVPVPLNHWVYSFLERLEARHLIQPWGFIKPYTRRQVARTLVLLKQGKTLDQLNGLEKGQLAILEEEFAEEFAREEHQQKGPDWGIFDRHWFVWQRENNYFQADYVTRLKLLADGGDSYDGTASLLVTSSGGESWGYLQDKVGYYFYGADNKKKGPSFADIQRKNLVPWQEDLIIGFSEYVEGGTAQYFDRTRALVSFKLPWFEVLFGRAPNQWGPGRFSQLTLSGNTVELDHFKLSAEYGRIRFTSIQAKCFEPMVDTLRTSYFTHKRKKIYREKYMAAHRAEITFPKNIILGVNEVLLYGDRGLEFAYLVPTTFYWSVEHSLHDQDNSTLSADISVKTVKNLHLYGELFIDDMSTDSLYSNWYGNKWAGLAGLYYCNPPFVPNLDLSLEYARVEPWVYTHWTGIAKYTNHGFPLGQRLGPHSDQLVVKAGYQVTPSLSGAVTFSQEREGQNFYDADSVYHNIGGDINDGHDAQDPVTKRFLREGEVETRRIIGIEGNFRAFYKLLDRPYWNVLRDLSVTVGYYWVDQRNILVTDDEYTRGDRQDHRVSLIAEYHFY